MDLKQIEYFVRVAEMGSFTRAAISLDIAQPALSRQIRLLEVELRQNLLTRNGRGALPTPAGRLLLEHGRGILHQVALTYEEMGAARGALSGKVSIGLPPSLSKLMTVRLVKAFATELPKAQLTLREGFSVLMHEGLRAGHLDLAVLYNPELSPDLEMSTLHEDQLALISPYLCESGKSGPDMTLSDVAALPLILPSRPNAFRLLIEAELALIGKQPNIVLEVDSVNAILSLVREGMGHAVLPGYTLDNFEQPSPFLVRPIHSPVVKSQLRLAWSSRRPTTQTHKKCMELITRELQLALRSAST